MNKFNSFKLLVLLVIAGMVLTACAGGGSATQTPVVEQVITQTPVEEKVAASGFVCPEPEYSATVTSTELNMFVWPEYIPQDIVDCFELVYGVKVNRDEFSSAEEMFAKLSQGNTSYDVIHVSDNVVPPSIRLGLLAKLDKTRLQVISNFDTQYLDLSFDPGNLYTIPYEVGTDAIAVNTETVKDLPKSWEDLWKPEFKGRIISIDDSRAIIGVALLTLGYDVNTTDAKQLDEAKQKLLKLMPNIKVFDSGSPKTPLLAGDVDLGILFSGEAVLAHQQNPAIQYIYPVEGPIVWQDNWAVAANAPHEDLAYAWLNYSMQANLFWMMLRDFPYTNPNKAALDYAKGNATKIKDSNGSDSTIGALYDAYINSTNTNIPANVFANGHRAVDVGDATPLFDQIWVEIKGGQ